MATPQGAVQVQQQSSTLRCRVAGWARMPQGLALRRRWEQARAAGVSRMVVDLRDCSYMDSTFLGTLLFFNRALQRQPNGDFVVVAPSQPCCKLFQEVAVLDILHLESDVEDTGGEWDPLPTAADDPEHFERTVVQAHEQLAELPGPTGATFRAAVDCLKNTAQK